MGGVLVVGRSSLLASIAEAARASGHDVACDEPARAVELQRSARASVIVVDAGCTRELGALVSALRASATRPLIVAVIEGAVIEGAVIEGAAIEGAADAFDDVWVAPVAPLVAAAGLRLLFRLVDAEARAEVAREEQAQLRLALAAARIGTWDVDVATGAISWSEGAHEVLGVARDALGASASAAVDVLHADDRAAMRRTFEEALRAGTTLEAEHRVASTRGEPRWVHLKAVVVRDAAGAPVRLLGTVIDVTARKSAELSLRRAYEELRESDERFRVVARATSDAVWDWDFATDVVTWNENLSGMFGYTSTRTPIAWWEDVMHPEDRVRVSEGIRSTIDLGEDHWADEYRFRRADGTYASVLDRGVVIRDVAGRPARMIGAMMDITERRELQARLLVADRMASVGTLAAGVAHEINNPLAYVVANLDLAIADLSRHEPALDVTRPLEILREAKDGAARVRRIVQDLKTFSRADDEVLESVDLREVVESSINLAMNEIRHRAKLVRDLRAVPPVDANEGRLGQVVVNLLVNAAQAIAEGAADRNEIVVSTREDDAGHVVLEVKDTGPGMPPEIVRRIFDPFYTTKSPGEGTGLGLTICHGIVSSMDGTIEVESEVGAGTLFRIVLPAARANVRRDKTSSAAPPRTDPRRGRLLVIDDEPMIGKSVQLMLDEWHDVTAVVSARDGLEVLQRDGGYDAILCDLMMPEMTGMEFHEQVRRAWPELARRIVFVTGGAFTPRARAFLEETPNPRLEKPFDLDSLREAIASVMRSGREPIGGARGAARV